MLPSHPKRLGKYELLRLVAVGGMAEVFLGRAAGPAGFSKLVAIKRIHEQLSDNQEFVEMFLDEARLASRLDHPNIVQIIDLGRAEAAYFLAMEYIHGKTLRDVIQRAIDHGKVLPLEAIFTIARGVLSALAFAHGRRGPGDTPAPVIHRDVSPQNILIGYAGNVKLADFGIAKAQGSAHVTQDGVVKGKAYYMAPEQIFEGRVDPRVDLYAFGVVLYECLTGRKLFGHHSSKDMFNPKLRREVPRPSQVVPSRPVELDPILERLLAADPRRRYQSCTEVIEEIDEAMLGLRQVISSERLGTAMRFLFPDELREEEEVLSEYGSTPTPELGDRRRSPASTGPIQSLIPQLPRDADGTAAVTNPAIRTDAIQAWLTPSESTDSFDAEAATHSEVTSPRPPGAGEAAARAIAATRSPPIPADASAEVPLASVDSFSALTLPEGETSALVQPVAVTQVKRPGTAPWIAIAVGGGLAMLAASIGLHAFLSSGDGVAQPSPTIPPPKRGPVAASLDGGARTASLEGGARAVASAPDQGRTHADLRLGARVRLRTGPVTPPPRRRDPPVRPEPPPRPTARGTGFLSLTAEPGGEVFLNRRSLGRTPLAGAKLPAGTHTLVLRAPGVGDYPITVTIVAGQQTTRQVQVGKGTLRINAIPWARVFLDGKMLDVTPIKPLKVLAGPHTVELVFPGTSGEQRHRVRVVVRAGESHQVIHNFLKPGSP